MLQKLGKLVSMKRVFILLLVSILNAAMFGQRKDVVSLSLEEIKDMPQKIIKAYFKPVYTLTGVSYPLMQWYASENKIDIWDKNTLNKFNSSIYGFKENPIKAAEFALQFCRTFGERDFIANFQAIGFNTVEINSILRCYKSEKKWQELDIIKEWQKNGFPRFANNEASVSAKYHINIDSAKMKKYLSENIKRNIFNDYMRLEIGADGSYSSNRPQYEFIQISDIVPAQKTFTYADTTFYVPVSSSIKITEDLKDDIDYRVELEYNKKENRWVFKEGTFCKDYWKRIKKSTPYYDYINVAIEKVLTYETLDSNCKCELEFSIAKSVIKVSQADEENYYNKQEVIYKNEEIPYVKLVTLYKKNKGEYYYDKILLEEK